MGYIPWHMNDDSIEELAYSLWSHARYSGAEPLDDSGSWLARENYYMEAARWVAGDMDRRAA